MSLRIAATTRAGLVLALLSTTLVTATADAGRPCPLLRDPPGDGGGINHYGYELLPNDRSLDLLSVDMASRGPLLEATVRINRLDRLRDQWFEIRFQIGSDRFYLGADLPGQPGAEPDGFSVGYFSETDGDAGGYAHLADVPGRVDTAGNRIGWVLDTRLLHHRQPVRRGTTLSDVQAESFRSTRLGYIIGADLTTDYVDFVHGTPACASPAARR